MIFNGLDMFEALGYRDLCKVRLQAKKALAWMMYKVGHPIHALQQLHLN